MADVRIRHARDVHGRQVGVSAFGADDDPVALTSIF
jgi:hypothetical protein